jgi:hypothetical protein
MLNTTIGYCQKSKTKYRKLKNTQYQLIIDNDSLGSFYISKNPITNKEYITYLCWISDVYESYPDVLINAIPNLNTDVRDSLLAINDHHNLFQKLIVSNPLSQNYLFNPRYIDYPVCGVSLKQAMTFLNWLSDRYNESILFQKSFQIFNSPSQSNESCFTTEAYLAGQYQGLVGKLIYDPATKTERQVIWSDRLLIPSFRLPVKYESMSSASGEITFMPYKHNKFLDPWVDYYISGNKNEVGLMIETQKNSIIALKVGRAIRFPDANINELYLDSNLESGKSKFMEIFTLYGQEVVIPDLNDESNWKDSKGKMPYILISEDEQLNPIFINRNTQNENYNKTVIHPGYYNAFRYALSALER